MNTPNQPLGSLVDIATVPATKTCCVPNGSIPGQNDWCQVVSVSGPNTTLFRLSDSVTFVLAAGYQVYRGELQGVLSPASY